MDKLTKFSLFIIMSTSVYFILTLPEYIHFLTNKNVPSCYLFIDKSILAHIVIIAISSIIGKIITIKLIKKIVK